MKNRNEEAKTTRTATMRIMMRMRMMCRICWAMTATMMMMIIRRVVGAAAAVAGMIPTSA
jgi:hypothetical protein